MIRCSVFLCQSEAVNNVTIENEVAALCLFHTHRDLRRIKGRLYGFTELEGVYTNLTFVALDGGAE